VTLDDFTSATSATEATTRRLVEAAAAHWSDDQIRQFSNYVGSYSPSPGDERDPKQRRNFLKAIEHVKLQLLQSLPTERLTKATTQRVAEGMRKFGERRVKAEIEARWIASPMSADSMSKAKNEEIINAFKRLPDATEWNNPRDWMKGGNVQLSREFASFAKAARSVLSESSSRLIRSSERAPSHMR
jgi:hypothetical protein